MRRILLAFLLCALALQAEAADDLFGIDDLLRLADVGEPTFSPDGAFLAYSVTTNDLVQDKPTTDLWRVRWDGSDQRALTRTPASDEWQPRWSPDGLWIAFLSDRGDDEATTQVWVMPAASGEAELGTPWANREIYDRNSYPLFHADRIKTPTSFYCEELDVNMPCIGSEQMYQALRSLNVPTELVRYPAEWHPVTVPSYLRDRMQRHLDWYGRYLISRP